jgi:hypothetical protein
MPVDRSTAVGNGYRQVGAVPVQCLPVDDIASKLQESIYIMMLGSGPESESMIAGKHI